MATSPPVSFWGASSPQDQQPPIDSMALARRLQGMPIVQPQQMGGGGMFSGAMGGMGGGGSGSIDPAMIMKLLQGFGGSAAGAGAGASAGAGTAAAVPDMLAMIPFI